MTPINLHELEIPYADEPLHNFSKKVAAPHFDSVEVMFRNQEERLIELIGEFNDGAIFGCVAWLTSIPVLKALGDCQNVQIIVQKEDWLRPDLEVNNVEKWKSSYLLPYFNRIGCGLSRHDFRDPICNLSYCGDATVQGVRCVGNFNQDRKPAFPRSHHKFLVFCQFRDGKYVPVGLWTGSYNLTKNASFSFENVLYFTDHSGTNEVLEAYLSEHHQIFALSEPLNWEHVWAEPELRIGT